jgi:hypothetical protein
LCDFIVLKLKVTVTGCGFNITMVQAKLQLQQLGLLAPGDYNEWDIIG